MRESLEGLRVLVVEDDPLIGVFVENMLLDNGCKVDGPHISLCAGQAAAQSSSLDVALLDVNLAGRMSYPIAETLVSRGIPFVLTSGYGEQSAPPDNPDWPFCSKPFTFEALTASLKSVLA